MLVGRDHYPPRGLVEFCRNNARVCAAPQDQEADAAPAATAASLGAVRGAQPVPLRAPNEATTASAQNHAITLTPDRWSELRRVNWSVNRSIKPRSDLETFGQVDYWSDETDVGDCDDYVMTKRAELIRRGWPSQALLIVLADTEEGERHVVLLAVTDRGDFVLDNRFDQVLPWDRLRYDWIARQSPDNILHWRRVAST